MNKTKVDYSFLALIATIYIILVIRYQSVPQYLLFSTAGFAIIYFLWGLMHHHRTRSLHPRIVLEYALVSVLGVIIISTLLI